MSDTPEEQIPEGGYLGQRVIEDALHYGDANPESGVLPPNDAEVGYLQRRVAEDAQERLDAAKAQGAEPDDGDVAAAEAVTYVVENVTLPPAREDYEALTKDHLKSLAEQRDLPTGGTKEDLVDRLAEADQAEMPDDAANLSTATE